MNNVNLIGRLTKDPELKYLANGNGTAVATFTLAVDRNLSKDKREEAEKKGQATADFILCKAWGKTAETVANYLAKGRLVGITGRIETGSYEAKDGTRRYTTEVVVYNLDILEWQQKEQQKEQKDTKDIDGFYTIENEEIPF